MNFPFFLITGKQTFRSVTCVIPKLQADVLIRSSDTIFSSPDQVRSFLPTRLQKASRHVFFPSGLQSSSSSNFSAGPADSVCYSIVIQSSSCLFQTKLSQPVLPLLKPQHGFPVFDNNFFGQNYPDSLADETTVLSPTHSASVLFSF